MKNVNDRMSRLFVSALIVITSLSAYAQASGPAKTKAAKTFTIGVIDELASKILGENRVLNICLPEGYNAKDTARYDVVYLLDGSADEDFIHVVGLYQFNSFEWIRRTPKTIIVGIANVDRKRDFTFPSSVEDQKQQWPTTGHSARFMDFIEKELQPYIEKNYKTNSSKTLIGQSLGGLLATEILLKRPALFTKYIIVSPSIWWDNASLLNQGSQMLEASFTKPLEVYIGVGKEGLTPGKNPRVMEVDANLLAEKIRSGKSGSVKLYFDYLPEDDHATVGHRAIYNALKLMADKE